MTDEKYDRAIYRTVPVVVEPTVVEIADIIWHMNADEQIVLLSCLKRRFCNKEAGLTQMAEIANALKELPTQKVDEAKTFVKCLTDYILEVDNV